MCWHTYSGLVLPCVNKDKYIVTAGWCVFVIPAPPHLDVVLRLFSCWQGQPSLVACSLMVWKEDIVTLITVQQMLLLQTSIVDQRVKKL